MEGTEGLGGAVTGRVAPPVLWRCLVFFPALTDRANLCRPSGAWFFVRWLGLGEKSKSKRDPSSQKALLWMTAKNGAEEGQTFSSPPIIRRHQCRGRVRSFVARGRINRREILRRGKRSSG